MKAPGGARRGGRMRLHGKVKKKPLELECAPTPILVPCNREGQIERARNMKISEVSRRTGLSVDTLRFYEKIGLIEPPPRDDAGRRDYGEEVIGWIGFLDQLNATGMPQGERVRYARLRAEGPRTATARREMLEAHREVIRDKLEKMRATLDLMDRKVALYREMERDAEHV